MTFTGNNGKPMRPRTSTHSCPPPQSLLLTTQCLLRSRCFLMHELHRAAAKRPTVDVSALTNAHSWCAQG